MDKIYSRTRIKLPKFNYSNKNFKELNSKNGKKIKFIAIILIAITVALLIIKAIEPVINKQSIVVAKSIATKISNEQATIVMANYKYQDLCSIEKDENGNIKMIKSNIIPVNEIISDVAVKIQNELNKTQDGEVFIRLGTLTGSKFLSGRGPKVNFKIATIGNVETDLKSEFSSAGINQTLHRIYLQVKCKVIVLTPFSSIEEEIINQVLLAEAVIVGDIPNTYYNLEGINKDNVLDIIE